MAPEIWIGGRAIGTGHPPFVIAEMSANHHGRLDTALELVDEAARAGADAIKLQTYRPDTLTLDSDAEDFQIRGGLWDGTTLYRLYDSAQMPWEWHEPIFARARAHGLLAFSSPFDSTAVDLLESLGAPAYKIASFEAVDLPLIRHAARTGKPLIISTGLADLEEIREAVDAARGAGCGALAILHCVSGYPAPAADYHLRTIPDLIARFGLVTGLSDHTLDNTTAVTSVALGASIIEKHFTLDRAGGGPDDSFSLEPDGLGDLCRGARTAWEALGRVEYGLKSSERGNVKFRRSLYFVRDLAEGDVITPDAVRSVRPGYGVAPKWLDAVIGRRVTAPIARHTPVRWEVLEGTPPAGALHA